MLEDVAWSYEDPLPESTQLGHFLSFDEARVDVRHDLPRRRLLTPREGIRPPLRCAAADPVLRLRRKGG